MNDKWISHKWNATCVTIVAVSLFILIGFTVKSCRDNELECIKQAKDPMMLYMCKDIGAGR